MTDDMNPTTAAPEETTEAPVEAPAAPEMPVEPTPEAPAAPEETPQQ